MKPTDGAILKTNLRPNINDGFVWNLAIENWGLFEIWDLGFEI